MLADSISSSLSSTLFVDLDNRLLQGLLGKHPSGAYMGEIPTNSERGAFCGWETGFFYRACYELPEAWKSVETITDTWEDIVKSCDNGTYKTKYSLGDTKVADFGDEGLVLMRLVGFDCDELSDGTGYAHMSWIGEHCLKTIARWADYHGNNYSSSNIIKTIDTMIYKLPYILQSKILEVKKTCFTRHNGDEVVNSKIWVPSVREYLNGYESSGPVYTNPPKPIKLTGPTPDGSATEVWLRTIYAHPTVEDHVMVIRNNGTIYDFSCSGRKYLVPGFCL